MVALTVEAAAMAKIPLAGTDWVPGALLRLRSRRQPSRRLIKMAKIVCVLYDDPVDGYPPSYARDDIPKIEKYPDGQTTPTPSAIDFHPGELLGCVSGELGLRKFLEEADTRSS